MEFNEIVNYCLRILDMLDKIYHAVIKEVDNDAAGSGNDDTE